MHMLFKYVELTKPVQYFFCLAKIMQIVFFVDCTEPVVDMFCFQNNGIKIQGEMVYVHVLK